MSEERSFSSKVVRSLLYSGVGNTISKVLNVVALLVVLKLIAPEEFGLASIVLAIFAIVQSVTELGLGVALVQAQDIERRHIDALFWLSLLFSGAIYALILVGAPLVGFFYDDPALVPLLRVYGVAVVVFAFYFVPKNLLTKELAFDKLVVVENVSLLASSLAMVYFAYLGYGAWAIIVGELGNRVGQLVLCQLYHPYLPRPSFDFRAVREQVSFGLYATGSRLLYNFQVNADYLIVGKVFGPEAVGIYTLAYRIISDPVRTLVSTINQVAYPAFARLQDQRDRLRNYFFTIARGSLLLVGTVLILVAVYIDAILRLGGYEQWLGAVPLIHVFAVIGLIRCVSPLVPQLLNAVGRARLNFYYSLSNSIFMPLAFLIGAQYSLMGVAWAWVVGYPLVVLLLFYFGAQVLEMGLLTLTGRVFAGVLTLLPAFGVAVGMRLLLENVAGLPLLVVTVVGVLATLATGLGAAYLQERETIAILRGRRAPAHE